jgi:hypothetical protein
MSDFKGLVIDKVDNQLAKELTTRMTNIFDRQTVLFTRRIEQAHPYDRKNSTSKPWTDYV